MMTYQSDGKLERSLHSSASSMGQPRVTTTMKDNDEQSVDIEQPGHKPGKKYKIITASILLTGVLIAASILGGAALYRRLNRQENFSSKAKVEGRILKENIKVDYTKELIFVSNPEQGDINGLDALHDYAEKILAFKDTTVDRCFIDRLYETFHEGLDKWEEFSKYERVPPERRMIFIPEPINADVLKTFAGENTAKHCEGVQSHWIVEPGPGDIDLQPLMYRNTTVRFVCGPATRTQSRNRRSRTQLTP